MIFISNKYFFYKILKYVSLIFLLLILSFFIINNNESIQNKITQFIAISLNKKFGVNLLIDKINIDILGNIKLNNIKIIDHKQKILISIPKVNGKIDLFYTFFQYNLKKIKFIKLIFNNPKFFITTYQGDSINNMSKFINYFFKKKITNSFNIIINNFKIKKNYLKISNENFIKKKKIILNLNLLNSFIKNFIINNNLIKLNIYILHIIGKFKNKNFNIYQFSTNFFSNKNYLHIYNLKLKTNQSKIDISAKLNYENSHNFLKIIKNINIQAEIRKSYINSKDLQLFFDSWSINFIIFLQCKISGILTKKLILSNLYLKIKKNKIKTEKIIFLNIFDKEKFKIYQKNNCIIEIYYKDFINLFIKYINKETFLYLKKYCDIKYYGSFIIGYQSIIYYGIFNNNIIGVIYGKTELYNYSNKHIKYKGRVSFYNFLPFINKIKLQFINARFKFNGEKFYFNKIQSIGTIRQLLCYGVFIKNISVNGKLIQNFFNGEFSINDPQININFKGKFNFLSKKRFLIAKAKIKYFNLKILKLEKYIKFSFKSYFKSNIQWENINDLKGYILFNKMIYNTIKKKFCFPRIFIKSIFLNKQNQKILISSPGIINVLIFGHFKFNKIKTLIKNNIRYMINEEKYYIVNSHQFLKFYINITHNFINYFHKKIKLLSNCIIQGYINDNKLKIDILTKKIQIKKNIFYKINFRIKNNFFKKKKKIIFNIGEIFLKNYFFKKILIFIVNKNNKNLFLTKIYIFNSFFTKIQKIKLSFYKNNNLNINLNNLIINIKNLIIEINGCKWMLNNKNEINSIPIKIDLINKRYIINQLILKYKESSFLFSCEIINNYYKKIYNILNKIYINNFTYPIYLNEKIMHINTKIDGNFFIKKFKKKIYPNINLIITSLYLNKYILDKIKINIFYNKKNKYFFLKNTINKDNHIIFTIFGNTNFSLHKKPYLNFNFNIKKLTLKYFEDIINNNLVKIDGNIKGYINLAGEVDKAICIGKFLIKKFGITINYNNIHYKLLGSPIITVLNSRKFLLTNCIFQDINYNTQALMNGIIFNKNYIYWYLSLMVSSKNLLFYNVHPIKNNLLYGTIFGKGYINIFGDISYLNILIKKGEINNKSKIVINLINPEYLYEERKLVEFIQDKFKNKYNLPNKDNNNQEGIYCTIETRINKRSDLKIIINSYLNNFIKSRGNGSILIKIPPIDNVKINGKYFIMEGFYHFLNEEIPLLKMDKKFQIQPGGSISLRGHIKEANINISSCYIKPVYNLKEYINFFEPLKNHQEVLAELRIEVFGKLAKPKLNFNINFMNIDQNIKEELQNKMSDKDEKITQFSSIFLLGKFFIPPKNAQNNILDESNYNIRIEKLENFLFKFGKRIDLNFNYMQNKKNIYKSMLLSGSILYNINNFFAFKNILYLPFNNRKNIISYEKQFIINTDKYSNNNIKFIFFIRSMTDNIEKINFHSQLYGWIIIYTASFNHLSCNKNILFQKLKNKK